MALVVPESLGAACTCRAGASYFRLVRPSGVNKLGGSGGMLPTQLAFLNRCTRSAWEQLINTQCSIGRISCMNMPKTEGREAIDLAEVVPGETVCLKKMMSFCK